MYIYIADYHLKKILGFELNVDFIFDIASKNKDKYPFLSSVDPYGVTYFNN